MVTIGLAMGEDQMKAKLYKDRSGKWRWRIVAENGRKVACSGESFHSKSNAKRAVSSFMLAMRKTMFTEIE